MIIQNKPPNVKAKMEFRSLHVAKATFTILSFGESDCGHCKTAVPKLKTEILGKY